MNESLSVNSIDIINRVNEYNTLRSFSISTYCAKRMQAMRREIKRENGYRDDTRDSEVCVLDFEVFSKCGAGDFFFF